MSRLVNKAEKIAKEAHAGQVDKAGKPYIGHPAFVASIMKTDEEKIVAWLHDVLEDTHISVKDLSVVFSSQIMFALDALTHRDGESYDEYIERIRRNPLATRVKLADLTHNMDLTRLAALSEEDLRRIDKYKSAYKVLSLS